MSIPAAGEGWWDDAVQRRFGAYRSTSRGSQLTVPDCGAAGASSGELPATSDLMEAPWKPRTQRRPTECRSGANLRFAEAAPSRKPAEVAAAGAPLQAGGPRFESGTAD